jgi:hypothetical protein
MALDSFNQQPVELRAKIARHLITNRPYETAYELSSFMRTSRYNHNVVMRDPRLKYIYTGLVQALQTASRLADRIGGASASDQTDTLANATDGLVKRQMYGRGKLDLLQARLIGAT